MPGRRRLYREYRLALVDASPLRRIDARAKLALSLAASLAVMMPLERLAIFMAGYALFLAWARLLPAALRQLWRLKWVLLVLFALDWWLVGPELAVVVSLRLALLAGAFALLFSTTTPGEFSAGLERMRLPYRYAFSLTLAFQSLTLLDEEWRAIVEAQKARGLLHFEREKTSWRRLGQFLRRSGDLVALTVPAIVLTTQRAWSATEAAYARGFDSPNRRPYAIHRMGWRDWLVLVLAAGLALILIYFT